MPRTPTLTAYLTLSAAAVRLGMASESDSRAARRRAARRLREQLSAKERRTRKKIFVRLHDAPNAPLLVTLALLRRHCPEFFDGASEASKLVQILRRDLDSEFDEYRTRIQREIETVSERLDALERNPSRARG